MVAKKKKNQWAQGGGAEVEWGGPVMDPVPPGKRQKTGSGGSAAAAADAYMNWLTGDGVGDESSGSTMPKPTPKAVGVVKTPGITQVQPKTPGLAGTPPKGQVVPPPNGPKGKGGKGKGGKGQFEKGQFVPPPQQQQYQLDASLDWSSTLNQQPMQQHMNQQPMNQQPMNHQPMNHQPMNQPPTVSPSSTPYLPPVETNPYALAVQAGWSQAEVLVMQTEGISPKEEIRSSLKPDVEKKALDVLVTLKEQMHQLKLLQKHFQNRRPPAPPQKSAQQQAQEQEQEELEKKKKQEEELQRAVQQQMRRAEMHTEYEQQMAQQYEQIQAQQIGQMQLIQQQMELEQQQQEHAKLQQLQAPPPDDRQDQDQDDAPKVGPTNHMTELQCSILHNTMLSQQAFLRDQVAQLESQLERTPDGLQQQLEQQKQMISDAMQQVQQTQAMAAEQISQLQAQAVLTNEETEHMQQLQQHQQMQEQHYQQLEQQMGQVSAQADMEPHYRHKLLQQQLEQHQLHLDPQYQQLLRKQQEAAATEQDGGERKGDPDTGGFIEELQQTGQLRGTKICIFYLCSRCRKGFRCPDRHPSEADCNLARAEYKNKPCRFGNECRTPNCLYNHEDGEERIGLKGSDSAEDFKIRQKPPPDFGPGSGPEAARRAAQQASAKPNSDMRPGDWFCPKCNNLNFRYRTNCKTARCREPRPNKI